MESLQIFPPRREASIRKRYYDVYIHIYIYMCIYMYIYIYIYIGAHHVVRPNCALSKLSNTLKFHFFYPLLARHRHSLFPFGVGETASLVARRATEEILTKAPEINTSSTAAALRAPCCSPLELGRPQPESSGKLLPQPVCNQLFSSL